VHGKKLSLANDVDYALFHSPYTKLVQKSWARMVILLPATTLNEQSIQSQLLTKQRCHGWLQNYLEAVKEASHPLHESLRQQNKLKPETTYEDNAVMKEVMKFSEDTYKTKVMPSLTLPKELGNSYCASLYTSLLSLIVSHAETASGTVLLLGE